MESPFQRFQNTVPGTVSAQMSSPELSRAPMMAVVGDNLTNIL